MEIEFRDPELRGRSRFEGDLVWLPSSLRVVARDGLRVEVGPASDGTHAPDVLVGAVEFLTEDQLGRLSVGVLDIDPPPPFRPGDVDLMWSAIRASPMTAPKPKTPQGLAPVGGVWRKSQSVLTSAAARVQAAALSMLQDWPTVDDAEVTWRQVDLPGGREDLVETERRGDRWPSIVDPTSRRLPSWTARRTLADRRWTSETLSAAAALLLKRLREFDLGSPLKSLEDPLYQVLRRCSPQTRLRDAPTSAWPRRAQQLLSAIQLALQAIQAWDAGPRSRPHADLWRLYESWIGAELISSLERVLGQPATDLGQGAFRWRPPGDLLVDLRLQARIGLSPTNLGGLLAHPIRSVTSELIPDGLLIVSRRRSHSPQHLFVIDAKLRKAAAIEPSDAAAAGAKYMWSLRQRWGRADRAVHCVYLATPAAEPIQFNQVAGRIFPVKVLPSTAGGATDYIIERVLDSALDQPRSPVIS